MFKNALLYCLIKYNYNLYSKGCTTLSTHANIACERLVHTNFAYTILMRISNREHFEISTILYFSPFFIPISTYLLSLSKNIYELWLNIHEWIVFNKPIPSSMGSMPMPPENVHNQYDSYIILLFAPRTYCWPYINHDHGWRWPTCVIINSQLADGRTYTIIG